MTRMIFIFQAQFELSTFTFLKDSETQAIPRRLQSISDDVDRQTERERKLQETFRQAQLQMQQEAET